MATPGPRDAPLPGGPLRRHIPKVGAQCGNPARWDLCGGGPTRKGEGPSLPRLMPAGGLTARRRGALGLWLLQTVARVLLPHLSPVVIDGIDRVDGVVVVAAHGRARGSRCRRCGRVSTRVHPVIGGTWRIFPSLGGRSRVVDGAPVLLRPRRLQCWHFRRAGTGVNRRGTRRFVTLWGLRQTAAGAFAASDAAGLVGPHGDLDAVSGAELSHEAGEVGFGGAWGDVELVGDLIVGAALGDSEAIRGCHEDCVSTGWFMIKMLIDTLEGMERDPDHTAGDFGPAGRSATRRGDVAGDDRFFDQGCEGVRHAA